MNKTILFASIAALAAVTVIATFAKPVPAYGEIDPAEIVQFAAKDTNRLRGNVIRAVTQKSPYVDILEGGTMEAGISDTQQVVVQERAVLNQSLVNPAFVMDTEVCGTTGPAAEVGSTNYSYALATNRGKGPLVCIKGMWSAFKTAYSAAEQSLKQAIVQLNNADVRYTLVSRSGLKATLHTGASFEQMFAGTMQAIDTPFTTDIGLPDTAPTFKFLEYLGRMMREDFLVEPFEGNQGEPILKVIGSQEVISGLRDEAGIREDHRYLAAGQYQIGKTTLTRYRWEGPYRGFAFGVDPQPLRYNALNGSGQPIYLEPEIAVDGTNGAVSRPNPAWIRAKYETMLVMGRRSFMKLAPETYTGEGSFKFPAQGVSGELKWKNIEDNDKNVWADYGRHYYQFTRAYKPERPHAVCAVNFARNQVDFGFAAITSFGNWSSTGSL